MKERDDLPAPEIALDPGLPRRVTAGGLNALQTRIAGMAPGPERDALQARADLSVVPDRPSDPTIVDFGATVTIEDAVEIPGGKSNTFTIVGEDEIDIERGHIGIESPLAQALLGRHAGSIVFWKRPAGNRKIRITALQYEN
jgi:transcription elongation GreA/GreB family factor